MVGPERVTCPLGCIRLKRSQIAPEILNQVSKGVEDLRVTLVCVNKDYSLAQGSRRGWVIGHHVAILLEQAVLVGSELVKCDPRWARTCCSLPLLLSECHLPHIGDGHSAVLTVLGVEVEIDRSQSLQLKDHDGRPHCPA